MFCEPFVSPHMDDLDLPAWILLESSKDRLAAVKELSPLVLLFKSRPETELDGLLAQLFPHLQVQVDGVFIPSRANPDVASKMWHALFAIHALTSIINRQVAPTLGTPAPIVPPWSQILNSIAREWPNIWCWLQFLYSLKSSLTSEHRNIVVITVLEFLTLCFAAPTYKHPLQDLVVLDGLSLLAKIWYLQADEPIFRTSESSPMGLYLGMTLQLKGDVRRAGEHLLNWTGQNAKAVAAAALAQLHRYSPDRTRPCHIFNTTTGLSRQECSHFQRFTSSKFHPRRHQSLPPCNIHALRVPTFLARSIYHTNILQLPF